MTKAYKIITVQVDPPSNAPSWASGLVNVGDIINIGTNSLTSQKATNYPSYFTTPFRNIMSYTGGINVPTLGANGSYVLYGGGHTDYFFNDMYRFDYATATWSRIIDPFVNFTIASTTSGVAVSGYAGDNFYGEYLDVDGLTPLPAQPQSTHTYGRVLWTPQGSLGSDPNGYYVLPWAGNTETSPTASPPWPYPESHTPYVHYAPMSYTSRTGWNRTSYRFTDVYPADINKAVGGASLWDSTRNLLISTNWRQQANQYNVIKWLKPSDGTAGDWTTPVPFWSFEGQGFYLDWLDMYMFVSSIGLSALGVVKITLVDPKPTDTGGQPVVYVINATNVPNTLTLGTGGVEFARNDALGIRRVVYYPGNSSNTVYWVDIPSTNPTSTTWNWNTTVMTGTPAPPPTGNSVGHYGRFRYVKDANCFFWQANENTQQAWKVW